MLIQSHENYIDLLPSIPNDWTNISFRGLLARGGFEVSCEYINGKIKKAIIISKSGRTLKLKNKNYVVIYNGKAIKENIPFISIKTKKNDLIQIKSK